MFKIYLLFIVLCYTLFGYSQKRNTSNSFDNNVLKVINKYKKESDFKNAGMFFLENKWDSTIVYSMKQLRETRNTIEVADYCHFFRAKSLTNKKIFKEAQNEFSKISKKFQFYYLIKFNLGDIALEQKKYELALSYYEVVEKRNNNNYNFNRTAFYHNVGLCYFHLNKLLKAEKYLIKSTEYQTVDNDTINLIATYTDLANLYYEQYKDLQAIPYFEKAYQLSKKVKKVETKQNAALNMAVVEENRNNLSKALLYRKEFENWKDSLNDQNKVWEIAEIEKKYIVKQDQKEINLLEAKNKIREIQRNWLFISSLFLLLIFGAGIYFYKQKIKQNKIIVAQKEKLNELNATKDRLFSIISHDLRSSVNALKISNQKLLENLESKNYKKLTVLLQNNSLIANGTYNLLDNLLNWAMLQTKQNYFYQESHRLSAIVAQVLYNYKPIMLNKNIQFEDAIDEDIFVFVDLDSIKIVLRNLLDNAIKFSKENDSITVYTQINDDKFCDLIIQDTGAGISVEVLSELLKDTSFSISKEQNNTNIGTGLGMQLCKSLIAKNNAKLNIESKVNKGTKIIITLPTS